MKKSILLFLFFSICSSIAYSQFIKSSSAQYQFNSLAINPGYTGSPGIWAFETNYFGNISEFQNFFTVSQMSLHGPLQPGGLSKLGVALRYLKLADINEIGIRPSFARTVEMIFGKISFGGALGINYIDFEEDFITFPGTVLKSFFSLDGGFGVYFQTADFFAGLSATNLFEKAFISKSDSELISFSRERPFYFHAGIVKRINYRFQIKPVVIVKYADNYLFPGTSSSDPTFDELAVDFNLSLIIQEDYWVSAYLGFSKFEDFEKLNRIGLSLNFIVGDLRLSYGLQRANRAETFLELPTGHLFSIGYDFQVEGEEPIYRYF